MTMSVKLTDGTPKPTTSKYVLSCCVTLQESPLLLPPPLPRLERLLLFGGPEISDQLGDATVATTLSANLKKTIANVAKMLG